VARETLRFGISGDSSDAVSALRDIMTEAQSSASGMARSLGSSFDRVRKQAQTAGKTVGSTMQAGFRKAAKAGQSVVRVSSKISAGVLAAGAAFAAFADQVAGTVDEINTLAAASGLSSRSIAGLRTIAAQTNKDLASIVPKDLAKRMLEASQGAGEARLAYDALGFSVRGATGELKSVDEALPELIDKIMAVESSTERAAIAERAFGAEGREMLSAFSDSDDLARAVDLTNLFGADVGPKATAAANAWFQATGTLTTVMEGAASAIFNALGPPATKAIRNFTLGFVFLFEKVRALIGLFPLLGDIVSDVMSGNIGLTEGWQQATDGVARAHEQAMAKAKSFSGVTSDVGEATKETGEETQEASKKVESLVAALDRQRAAAQPAARATEDLSESVEAMHGVVSETPDVFAGARQAMSEASDAMADPVLGDPEERREGIMNLADYAVGQFQSMFASIADLRAEAIEQEYEAEVAAADAILQTRLDAARSAFEAETEQHEMRIGYFERLRDEGRITGEAARERIAAERQAVQDAAKQRVQAEKQARKEAKKTRREEAKQAKKQFRLVKAIRIGQAIIDAASAALAMIPGFAFLGPGAPAAAAVAASAALGAQIAVIAKQKPPSFATGGVVSPSAGARSGHVPAYLEPGEGVASRRAMGDPDFQRALQAANRGEHGMAGAPNEVRVVVRYDDSIDRIVVEQDRVSPGRMGRRRP